GRNGCDGGGGGCAPNMYAWEFAWWGLDRDSESDTFVAEAPFRMYGIKNFGGAEYDFNSNGNWQPVNNYFGYGLPVPAPPAVLPDGYVRVLAQQSTADFQAQNLELNFIRFPVCQMACGGMNCGGGDCNGGCDCGCGSAFSMYGSCGVRYFFLDDGFGYATEFGVWNNGAWD